MYPLGMTIASQMPKGLRSSLSRGLREATWERLPPAKPRPSPSAPRPPPQAMQCRSRPEKPTDR
jgi:hypothetical protein